MWLKICKINGGKPTQYFILVINGTDIVMNKTWRTEAAARRWAVRNGYKVVD